MQLSTASTAAEKCSVDCNRGGHQILLLTAETAPLSRASVNISSFMDASVAFLSQETSAIHGVDAIIYNIGKKAEKQTIICILTWGCSAVDFLLRKVDKGALIAMRLYNGYH